MAGEMGSAQVSFKRHVPIVAFAVIAALGLTLAWTIHAADRARATARLVAETSEIAGDLEQRMGQYVALLRATRAVVETAAPGGVDGKLADFTGKLDLEGVYKGIQGLGYAALIPAGAEAAAEERYRLGAPIHPATTQPVRTPIVFLAPRNDRNDAAVGYDMYAEPVRRAAIEAAALVDHPVSSAPVTLVQEITDEKQSGFLVFLAARNAAGGVSGYVYAPFRVADLVRAAIGRERLRDVALRVEDIAAAAPLFERGGFDPGRREAQTTIEVAGRRWRILTSPSADDGWSSRLVVPALVAAGGLLLGAVFAAAYREQQRSEAAARQLAHERQRMLEDRELLMQEMNHRLKNAIARISGIARSSARQADSVAGFMTSFTGRLDAMAAAQDALTRSRWEKALLGDILANEIAQVFGDPSRVACAGPDIDLDERQAQAFGLIFHELTTNAAKYGAARAGGLITVNWRVEDGVTLFEWIERSPQPIAPPAHGPGFGSKLIDALVAGELKGAMERRFEDDGVKIRISSRLNA
jgi:two-component sensor histidine kinase